MVLLKGPQLGQSKGEGGGERSAVVEEEERKISRGICSDLFIWITFERLSDRSAGYRCSNYQPQTITTTATSSDFSNERKALEDVRASLAVTENMPNL